MKIIAPLLALASLSAFGCGPPPQDCVARGATTNYTGSSSFTGEATMTGATLPLVGASAQSLLVYDFTQDCSYDSMEFLVSAGTCELWVSLDDSEYDTGKGASGDFLSAGGHVEDGQSCVFTLPQGKVELAIQQGSFDAEPTSIELKFSGPVTGVDGVSSSGYLQVDITVQ